MHLQIPDPPKLLLTGTPREIGLSHGRHLRLQIEDQMSVYDEMFRHSCNINWDEAREDAEKFRATIERLTPHLHEEMQGIADGAGVHILDIVTLNCRSEITFGKFTDGCTSLSWKKSDGCRILAQNWDFAPAVQRNIAFMEIQQAGKPTIYMVGEAGIVGKIGFNDACVGTCLNAIRAHPCISSKLPIHVALRLCLESTSVAEAVRTLESLGGVGSSQHILVSDSDVSLGLELSPLGNIYLSEDEYGMVTHTNHFLENHLVYEPPWLSGSPIRLERVRELSRGVIDSGVLSEDRLVSTVLREKVFSDLYNSPQSICGQEDFTRERISRITTLFNIVMRLDPKNLGAEVVVGRPGSGLETSVVNMPWR
ncbi:acyl-CoA:6-aminopenicillanic-acid-acyltransferase [Aspergillus heteromorphus CBS 117.55]|uniref:Acyl-CoA:6-aminopenicillanic-acid-acyltransferase n=1 Tax=Aspergillus heteromorphus CBS 117.55 TaxID=1448321 RepID=A0A317WUX5_9EURO|nr:acyl-CoA:6-aminopenicillanic-acid-acyltransferase [Aspergillus heteromorphus CBS 117.55]PWY90156.1 acyl-CoA:6-aminopenicillanic-acid-acyltransferase [Aspergillus heteromorphus CBS 117.55]